MAGSTLQLGLSGLLAAQRALNTTGHNITNVGTEGFSRQRAEQVADAGGVSTGNSAGLGVTITGVRRSNDQYLNAELNRTTAAQTASETQYQLSVRLDRLLSSSSTSLASYLNDFSSASDAVSRDPSSLPNRQVMLSEADKMIGAFRTLGEEISNMESEVNTRIQTAVADINDLSKRIAQLNNDITLATAGNANSTPNDLLDQRDNVIRQLSEQVAITTLTRPNGSIDVLSKGGESLIHGSRYRTFSTAQDPLRSDHLIPVNSVGADVSSDLSGGIIGGLLDYRSEVLDPSRASFGRLAAGMSIDFNAQHAKGLDLNNDPGGSFFSVPTPRINVAASNTGSGSITASLTSSSALTTSEYVLSSDDGANAYTLTRLSDNQTFAINTGGTSPYTNASVDGVQINITAGAASGDRFLIQPTAFVQDALQVAVTDPSKIAAANPVLGSVSTSNSGDAIVASVVVQSTTSLPLSGAPVSGDLTLTFNSANNQYILSPDPSSESPLAYNPATESGGKTFTLLGGSLEVTLSGNPANGDQLILSHNSDGTGDNRNAKQLGDILRNGLFDGGSLSLSDAYSGIVSQVGTLTKSAETNQLTFSNMLNQAQSLRDSISGVNLDEEAANLLRFQQAYQASAQVIAAADALFNTLMQAVSR